VDHNGNLTLSSGYPQVVAAPNLLSSSFMAGTYVGPSTAANGKATVTVSGPGVTDGGATTWSLSAAPTSDPCTYPGTATWYVGPVANSPVAARLKSAGITSTAWSYGVSSSPGCGGDSNHWTGPAGAALIGVSQSGNGITLATFSSWNYSALTDNSTPTGQITYTLKP
jgi:hypothetical protein